MHMLLEVALTVAAVVFCLKKWGALDWYSVYRRRWMPAADCYFCISFWLSLPVCVALLGKGWYGALAFASAALSAFILNTLIFHANTEN